MSNTKNVFDSINGNVFNSTSDRKETEAYMLGAFSNVIEHYAEAIHNHLLFMCDKEEHNASCFVDIISSDKEVASHILYFTTRLLVNEFYDEKEKPDSYYKDTINIILGMYDFFVELMMKGIELYKKGITGDNFKIAFMNEYRKIVKDVLWKK